MNPSMLIADTIASSVSRFTIARSSSSTVRGRSALGTPRGDHWLLGGARVTALPFAHGASLRRPRSELKARLARSRRSSDHSSVASLRHALVAGLLVALIGACGGGDQGREAGNIEPRTESGLRAAATEAFDALAAGDWGAAWDRLDRQSKSFISRGDYIRKARICGNPTGGLPIDVVLVRLEGRDRGVVRVRILGQTATFDARYEVGRWGLALSEAARQNFARSDAEIRRTCPSPPP
jgi:hypothetical protein